MVGNGRERSAHGRRRRVERQRNPGRSGRQPKLRKRIRERFGRGKPAGGKRVRRNGRKAQIQAFHGRPRVVDHHRGAGGGFGAGGLLLDGQNGLRRTHGPHHGAFPAPAADDPDRQSRRDGRRAEDQLPHLQPLFAPRLHPFGPADRRRLLHRRHDQRRRPLDSAGTLPVPALRSAEGRHGALPRQPAGGTPVEDRQNTHRAVAQVRRANSAASGAKGHGRS